MFSYRHAFHAGNHADVLKHITLLATLDYLTLKETALALIDTHGGNGLYRLDSDFARTSQESQQGIQRLLTLDAATQPPALARYLDFVHRFNPGDAPDARRLVYPGSPAIMQHCMRAQDQLQVFELQPADMRSLRGNLEQGPHAPRARVWLEDGWEGSLRLLPPASRRALVLCDPSYEIKTDYAQTSRWLAQALRKFATGTYLIWYPIIARTEAHELPRKLKTVARQAGRPWLHATLTVRSSSVSGVRLAGERQQRSGMVASGMIVINPPFTLNEQLGAALPALVKALGEDHFAKYTLETAGAA